MGMVCSRGICRCPVYQFSIFVEEKITVYNHFILKVGWNFICRKANFDEITDLAQIRRHAYH